MTIMASSTAEIDVNTLMLRAFQISGLMAMEASASGAQWEARAAFGRDILEMVVKNIQSDGNITIDVDLYDVTLTSGTASYALPASTLRAQGLAMYLKDASSVQLQVRQVDREEYQSIPNKDQSGTPTRYFAERNSAGVTLYLWMVPDTTGAVFTVQRQRLLANVSSGSASVEVERSWNKYLLWELAHHFAVAAGQEVQRCGYLKAEAKALYKACKGTSTQSVPDHIYVNHDGGVYR